MAKSDQPMTESGRSAREIEFVLRRAKWKRGPEVLRDLARAEAEAAATEHRTPTEKAKRKASSRRDRS